MEFQGMKEFLMIQLNHLFQLNVHGILESDIGFQILDVLEFAMFEGLCWKDRKLFLIRFLAELG